MPPEQLHLNGLPIDACPFILESAEKMPLGACVVDPKIGDGCLLGTEDFVYMVIESLLDPCAGFLTKIRGWCLLGLFYDTLFCGVCLLLFIIHPSVCLSVWLRALVRRTRCWLRSCAAVPTRRSGPSKRSINQVSSSSCAHHLLVSFLLVLAQYPLHAYKTRCSSAHLFSIIQARFCTHP